MIMLIHLKGKTLNSKTLYDGPKSYNAKSVCESSDLGDYPNMEPIAAACQMSSWQPNCDFKTPLQSPKKSLETKEIIKIKNS